MYVVLNLNLGTAFAEKKNDLQYGASLASSSSSPVPSLSSSSPMSSGPSWAAESWNNEETGSISEGGGRLLIGGLLLNCVAEKTPVDFFKQKRFP